MLDAEAVDTIVIGGGQSGLAMSYHLSRHGRDHLVLERGRVAERWHEERWDSLRFQFPNWSIALPGLVYDGPDPDGYAHYRDVAAFVEHYARFIDAPLRTGVDVQRLQYIPDSGFHLQTSAGNISARQVVVATGPFQRPKIPDIADQLPARIAQLHAAVYRNVAALPPGAVLVVGSGASGCQIADELLGAGRQVYLSVSPHRRVPRRYRTQDIFWWFTALGRFDTTIDSFPNRRPPVGAVFTGANGGYDVSVRRFVSDGGVALGRFLGVKGQRLVFDDDAEQVLAAADAAYLDFMVSADKHISAAALDLPEHRPDTAVRQHGNVAPIPELEIDQIGAVVWATGYDYDFRWIEADVLDTAGAPRQERGVTACRGLYFLGLHLMHTIKSGTLFGVGADASFIADHMEARRGNGQTGRSASGDTGPQT